MVLIAAYNSPAYGKFAYNLAHSIKDKMDIPICLLTDGKTGINTSIFDVVKLIEAPTDHCLFKINLNQYTPFAKTLYIDADTICMNDFSGLLESITQHEFWVDTIQSNTSYWLKEEAFTKPYQEVNTSLFYFTKEADHYFETLNDFYKIVDRKFFKNFWGKSNMLPDEALHQLGMSYQGYNFTPQKPVLYCDKLVPRQQAVKYNFLSMYGARIAKEDHKQLYDAHMFSVMKRAGLHHEYRIHNLYQKKWISL